VADIRHLEKVVKSPYLVNNRAKFCQKTENSCSYFVERLVPKITLSNVQTLCPKNGKLMTDYLGLSLLRFHALIDVYATDFLFWEPVPELIRSFVLCSPYASSHCLASSPMSLCLDFPCVITQARQSPGFSTKLSKSSQLKSSSNCTHHSLSPASLLWSKFCLQSKFQHFGSRWSRCDVKCWLEELRKYCNAKNSGFHFSVP